MKKHFFLFPLRAGTAMVHDACMAAASFVLALYLRLGDEQFHSATPYLAQGIVSFTAVAMIAFISMRLYRGLWRYASLPDMVALVKAVTVAIAVFYGIVLFATTRLEGVPRSVPFIHWLLLLAMLGAPRFLYRAVKDRTLRFDFRHDASRQIPLLLVGATDSAELFIRNCRRDSASPWRVVGILDDRRSRQNMSLHGVRVLGTAGALAKAVHALARKGFKPQRLVLCDETMEPPTVARLLEESEALGLTLGRLPRLSELKHGAVDKPEIREVAIEDLLFRAQHAHDRAAMQALINNKRVLITGAGGSIGSELVRQAVALNPAEILLLDQGEHALYQIDLWMQESAADVPRRAVLGDVRDAVQVRQLFREFRPEIVFHAAAIKHVPLSEANPLAAIETNVLGTCLVAQAAQECGAAIMVLISTDKAVHPTNVMGASKRLAERAFQSMGAASRHTRFVTVRFGNVLGSAGSVVPLFQRQLGRGGPITVTHPDMTRYFMTIREAVELVIQAAALGAELKERRAVFVLDMGKAIRITELATQIIRLSGLKDIEIVYTGLRPGEKLFEELFYDAEKVQRTAHPGILIAGAGEAADLQAGLEELTGLCRGHDERKAVWLLQQLVPEFQAPKQEAA